MEYYIVFFDTGEYEDRQDCPDAIFSSREKAEAYASERNKMLNELGLLDELNQDNSKCKDYGYRDVVFEITNYVVDYTGARFTVGGPYLIDVKFTASDRKKLVKKIKTKITFG